MGKATRTRKSHSSGKVVSQKSASKGVLKSERQKAVAEGQTEFPFKSWLVPYRMTKLGWTVVEARDAGEAADIVRSGDFPEDYTAEPIDWGVSDPKMIHRAPQTGLAITGVELIEQLHAKEDQP